MSNWLFQANPARFPVLAGLAAGTIDSWCIGRHRRDLASGDRAALWVSGRHEPGVYALGWVTGDPFEGVSSDEWSNPEDRGRIMTFCSLELDRILTKPVLRADLMTDPRFGAARILTQPQATNPFLITDEQWDAIEDGLARSGRRPLPSSGSNLNGGRR
jgi:hypothetical protein